MSSRSPVPARGKYACFAELARHETLGKDYQVRVRERASSSILVAAPHGGKIEAGTSEIAELIAAEDYHLFSFEGTKPFGENRALHITSHRFDHPACLELASRSALVLTIHGCLGESSIHVGGRDDELCARLCAELSAAGFKVEWPSSRYPGRHPLNICNRGSSAKGVQLEITHDLRAGGDHASIAGAVRAALARTSRPPPPPDTGSDRSATPLPDGGQRP